MAGKVKVVAIKNLDKCIEKFEKAGDIDLKPIISKLTRIVQRDAKILAPVDTGTLMNHIFAKTLSGETASKAGLGSNAIGVVYTNIEYAIYQEYGWSRDLKDGRHIIYSGKPFMRPALQKNEQLIERSVENYLSNKLKSIKK
mgnify:FL=1